MPIFVFERIKKMSYETGTAATMNDFMTKLSTFAVADSWTQDQYTAEAGSTDGKMSIHKAGVFVSFAWNSSQSSSIAVYQSLGFTGSGTNTWNQLGDSGCGPSSNPSTSSTWNLNSANNRFIRNIGTGPYTSYTFFSGASKDYIHVALEYSPFTYRHIGFGNLEKAWDWTGGEYCYGHPQSSGNPASQGALISSVGEGSNNRADRHASIHCEGLPGQPAAGKWATNASHSSLGGSFIDRSGNPHSRVSGTCPGGAIGSVFNNLPSNSGDGFLPMTPNAIFYIDITPSPDNVYFLGWQPDVRSLNMKNFEPQAEITVGADTWVVFPHVRKQNVGGTINESHNLGIAYKKIV